MSSTGQQPPPGKADALLISLAYVVLAAVWILVTDRVAVRLFPDAAQLSLVSQYKGLSFVALTSLLLYFTLRRTFRSIAGSKRALTDSERRFAEFMENLPLGIFLKDARGDYLYVNDYWARHFAPGKDWRKLSSEDLFASQLVEGFRADDKRVLETGHFFERNFLIPVHGKPTEWVVRKFPVQVSEGDKPLLGGFAMEVTEQRRMEEQLRQAAKMEAVGQLAGGVAHDFNNLLTVINGYAELLLQGPRDHAVAAREIRLAGQRAAELTRQLLAFSRRQILKPEAVILNSVVERMESILRRLLGAGIKLEVELAKDLRPVLADPGQLEQVVMNLAVNSRDAMPGGGCITIRTGNLSVMDAAGREQSGLPQGDYVLLSVADTGEGMSEEIQARIFEPFFTTKDIGKGTGLGLAMVYGIVKQSEGAIQVESRPGEGATFRIYLPVAAPGEQVHAADAKVESPRGNVTILLIEDDQSVRELLTAMLEELDYRVFAVAGGEEALEMMAAQVGAIQLAVTDVVMPGVGGPQVAGRLRAVDPALKVMYITGYSHQAIEQQHGLDRAAVVLQKPFDSASLAAAVRKALEGC